MTEKLRYMNLDNQITYVSPFGLQALQRKLGITQENVDKKKADAAAEHDDEWDKHNEAAVHAKQDLGIAMSLVQGMMSDFHNTVIIEPSTQTEVVDIGNQVTIYFEDEKVTETYTILGKYEQEADPDSFMSWQSPLAQAIMGKKVGETASYDVRGRQITVKVKKIEPGNF